MTAPSQTNAARSARSREERAAAAASHDWISHSLRHLERWVPWSIAVYTAWLALVSVTGVPALWGFVLYAGLIGKWAEARPARHQSELAGRGMALIVGAHLLHTYTAPEIGGPAGPFFFWLSITSLYYAFMLKPAWAAAVVMGALGAFTLSFVQAPSPGSWAEFMAQAGFLAIFPLLLAMKFGIVMRAPDEVLEHGRIDTSTSLYNMSGFSVHGDELLVAARREGRPLSVAVFDFADLLEVRKIYGSRVAHKLMARIANKLTNLAPDHGLAARTGPAEFSAVLPGMSREKALAAIARVLGSPLRIELDLGDDEIVLVPNFLVDSAGTDTASVDEIHRELHRELAQIGDLEQRRRDYLQRERERHSRPMPDVPQSAHPGRETLLENAPTMPAPLVPG